MANTTLTLELDADDYEAVMEACRQRDEMISGVPEGTSSREGALLAEICRGWVEMLDHVPGGKAEDLEVSRMVAEGCPHCD